MSKGKKTLLKVGALVVAFPLVGAIGLAVAATFYPYQGSSFTQVWDKISSDPYPYYAKTDSRYAQSPQRLPQYQVALENFYRKPSLKEIPYGTFLNVDFLQASVERTLLNRNDLLSPFQKLVHANGACLAGTWHIDTPNRFTGGFAQGTDYLVIGRVSVALTNTKRGDKRAFGLALKLFPTTDTGEVVETANVFTVDNLGGTLEPYVMRATLSNRPVPPDPFASKYDFEMTAATGKAFTAGELAVNSKLWSFEAFGKKWIPGNPHPAERQVYPISEIGLEGHTGQAVTPHYLILKGANPEAVDRADFRDEIRPELHNGHVRFDVYVGNQGESLQKIGQIDFTKYAASYSCDHALHFHHMMWRTDLD